MPGTLSLLRPPMPDPESEGRAARQELRAMLLSESFGDGARQDQALLGWLEAHLGPDRVNSLGPPDTSANTLLSTATQLATPGLYGLGPPLLRHPDTARAEALIEALAEGGIWERMQFVELMARGVGDWVLCVGVDLSGPAPLVTVRNVEPWQLWTRCSLERYDEVIEARHRRLRIHPVTGEACWAWDVWDLTPGRERYTVLLDGGGLEPIPAANLFLLGPDGAPAPPEGFVGEAYPYRYADGRPFLPLVWYAAQDTGSLWHESGRRGATRGALNSILYATYTGKVAHSATGSAVVAVGIQPPTGAPSGVGQPEPVSSVALSPGSILFLQQRPEAPQALLTEVGPGVNLDTLSRYALTYEAQQAYREGLGADDVSRDQANPTSAAALSIRNSGKRAAATRITPHFRRRDRELIGKGAALLRLAGGPACPETGWSVEYRQIPISPDEAKQQFELLQAQQTSGLLSTVDLYLAIHPGVSREAAIAELRRVRAEEALLTEPPPSEADPAAPLRPRSRYQPAPDPDPEPEPDLEPPETE